ncbi:hypothetical protein [Phormidium tenue]|uniref:DUF2281 domain-containing protein n=1 Tax=Phormidium tenue FACHB-1050 TaxID=2692857 RepID=A0ABR8CCZ6_9CYAN|nr:hypothetical protein [Phormidium tenue]MBD2317582.1 hypothetical protein [Phormidium tenue FACHB-1050]
MTLKELIYAEINKIEEDNLDELYQFVKQFANTKSAAKPKTGILNKLKRIKIQAPVDFATNVDLYMSGEKNLDNIH